MEEVVVWQPGGLVCTTSNRPCTPCHWNQPVVLALQPLHPTNVGSHDEDEENCGNRWLASDVEVEGFKPFKTAPFKHSWYCSFPLLYPSGFQKSTVRYSSATVAQGIRKLYNYSADIRCSDPAISCYIWTSVWRKKNRSKPTTIYIHLYHSISHIIYLIGKTR